MKNKSLTSSFPSLTKDFAIIYRFAVLGMLVVGFLFIHFSIVQEEKRIENELLLSAEKIEKIITTDLDYIKYQIYYTAQQIKLIDADEKRIKTLLAAFMTSVNNQVDVAVTWNAFSWINKDNYLSIDGAAGEILEPIDMSDRDYLKLTSSNREKLIFGKTIEGILSKRVIIPVGIGISSKRNSYLGTLVFGFDIDRILTKIEKVAGNEIVSFAILKDRDIAFASSSFNYRLFSIDKLLEGFLADNLEKKGEIIQSQNLFQKNKSFVFAKKIKNYPLEMIVVYDKEASYQQISNIFFKSCLFILVVVFAFIILFKQVYKKIVEPITNLSKFAMKISEKDFLFNIEKPVSKEFIDLFNILKSVKDVLEKEANLLRQLEIANQKISTENFNKSSFLAAISHDIRNPLSAIMSFSHLLQDEDVTKEEIKEWSKDIENCAYEVLQFINDLMDVNQITSGEFSIDLSNKINITDIIKRSIRVNHDFAQRRKIEIISHIDGNVSEVNLDPRRMKQILVNLINNSIKYSKEGTKIEIFLNDIFENYRQKIQIIIKDHGFGMDGDQVKKALEKYGCIDNENSGKIDSFGLGLPLVKKLVEMQYGIMSIESVIGVGTKITLTFAI